MSGAAAGVRGGLAARAVPVCGSVRPEYCGGSLYRARLADSRVEEVLRWPRTTVVWAQEASRDGRYLALQPDRAIEVIDRGITPEPQDHLPPGRRGYRRQLVPRR